MENGPKHTNREFVTDRAWRVNVKWFSFGVWLVLFSFHFIHLFIYFFFSIFTFCIRELIFLSAGCHEKKNYYYFLFMTSYRQSSFKTKMIPLYISKSPYLKKTK